MHSKTSVFPLIKKSGQTPDASTPDPTGYWPPDLFIRSLNIFNSPLNTEFRIC